MVTSAEMLLKVRWRKTMHQNGLENYLGSKHARLEGKNQPEVGPSQFFGLSGLRGGTFC